MKTPRLLATVERQQRLLQDSELPQALQCQRRTELLLADVPSESGLSRYLLDGLMNPQPYRGVIPSRLLLCWLISHPRLLPSLLGVRSY